MKELVKDILAGYSIRKNISGLFPRDKQLYVDLAKMQVIVGPRRVGKTTAMQVYMQELVEKKGVKPNQLVYFNFEDERAYFQPEQLDLILQGWKELHPEVKLEDCYFFFDEVQAAQGWEKFLNRINETLTKKICFTGSNSRLLHTEVNTVLRGRSIAVELLPLSFAEYCRFQLHQPVLYGSEKSLTEVFFQKYLRQGGYPEVIGLEDEVLRTAYLQEYYNTMLLRDIVEYHHLSNFQYLRPLFRLAATSIGQPVSIRRFFNHLKSMGYTVGLNSLYEVMNYAEDAYLFKRIGRYDHSTGKSDKSDKKLYWLDNGLLRALVGIGASGNGTLLENSVFLHLYRIYGSMYLSQIFYYSDQSHECDFVVLRGEGRPMPIQVCWSMEQLRTHDREVKGLLKACKYADVKEGLILTLEESGSWEQDGVTIRMMPVWRWMLETN
ncbi:putative AAA+ superfamily ATPase [Algoriphagus sp. 4150]|uniref:ATP-binding protein n=1 Tax=Algoriphagus sp. 4150 TaxID=2817756 RepID=UPI002860909F|nr:ATP-binding protein [Algoriphagus sp. 4150]MDR7129045.1 putative AAA+ superfamily ATPase [Algoriphagus sp. 4150]